MSLQDRLAREFGNALEVRSPQGDMPFEASLVAAPHTEETASAMVSWCGREKVPFVPCGSGTRLHIGAAPSQPPLLLSTQYLAQIIDWDEGNATVEAQSGLALSDLNATLSTKGQFVPLDDARNGSRSTLGGAVATNASGPSKLKWGAPRDLVVGLRAALSDGREVRAGAKVVKNVAGYDLPKLFTGSWGTLGLLTRVTIRLRPQDAARLLWQAEVARWDEARAYCHTLLNGPFEPTWLCVVWRDGVLRIAACFDAGEASLRAQRERLPSMGETSDVPGATGAPPQLGADTWQTQAVLPLARAGEWARSVAESGAQEVIWDAGTGAVRAAWRESTSAALATLRERARTTGGIMVVERAPREAITPDLVWGNPPPSLALMRGLKAKFDPANVCAPGRFIGGL